MKYLLIPYRVVFKVYYLICFVLIFLILYPIYYYTLSNPKRFKTAFLFMRFYGWVFTKVAFIPLRIKGIENIPSKDSYIICPNHTSFLDIPCLYAFLKRYFVFTGKKEIEKWPLFHIFYTSGMNILVDRESRSGSFKAFKRMSEEVEKGNPIVIFPEGTISKTAPKLTHFKSGAFVIAIQKQIPILPITFLTNWERIQRAGFFTGKAGPGFSDIVIHEPIITKGLTKDDAEALQIKVQETINEPLKKRFGKLVE